MPRILRSLALLLVLFCGTTIQAASLLGQWKLVEQTYGRGSSNFAADDTTPIRLEFSRDGATIKGRLRSGDADAVSWPRLTRDDARELREEDRQLSTHQDAIQVRYRVEPSPGDDLVLEVTEAYRVVEDGQALVGTVNIKFLRAGIERGSYLLHRRFEREP